MEKIDVSIFASSVRPQLYKEFFKSLEGTTVNYEVVFAGNKELSEIVPYNTTHSWKYIKTENIKPAQCYEIARRHCSGELISWTADDALYPFDCIGKAYRFWKERNNEKLILSLITKERYNKTYFLTDLNVHTLRGPGTPLMAPFALMSREYLERLGGIDRRYICGQYENDIVMRIYEDGGELVQFKDAPIVVDHYVGHGGVTTVEGYNRPFGQGYPHDRKILEGSWIKDGVVSKTRLDPVEKFEDQDILTKSQSFNLERMWQ